MAWQIRMAPDSCRALCRIRKIARLTESSLAVAQRRFPLCCPSENKQRARLVNPLFPLTFSPPLRSVRLKVARGTGNLGPTHDDRAYFFFHVGRASFMSMCMHTQWQKGKRGSKLTSAISIREPTDWLSLFALNSSRPPECAGFFKVH